MDCSWADYFQLEFDAKFKENYSKNEMFVCCCSPELAHDETEKLKLIYKDNNTGFGETVVFSSLRSGQIQLSNQSYFGQTTFSDCNVVGQNILLYSMFNSIYHEKARIIYLKGGNGSGKTSIAKSLANYLQERHLINKVHYLNMVGINSVHVFMAKIPGYSTGAFGDLGSTLKSSQGYVGENDTLLIFDNLDSFMNASYEQFKIKAMELLNTTSICMIILTSDHSFLEKSKSTTGQLLRNERAYTIPFIKPFVSAKLLTQMAADSLPLMFRNPIQLEQHQISSMLKTPKMVSDAALMLRQGKTLEQICHELEQSKSIPSDISGSKVEQDESDDQQTMIKLGKYIENIREIDQKAYKLLIFCSTFSNGVLLTDLEDYFDYPISEIFEILVLFVTRASEEQFQKREL